MTKTLRRMRLTHEKNAFGDVWERFIAFSLVVPNAGFFQFFNFAYFLQVFCTLSFFAGWYGLSSVGRSERTQKNTLMKEAPFGRNKYEYKNSMMTNAIDQMRTDYNNEQKSLTT